MRRRWLALVFAIGFAHAAAYALSVPPWQAPDEPGHLEYACLLSELGRPLEARDSSPALEQEIVGSLARHDFWPRVREPWPDPLPSSFADDPFLQRSGRQVGDEPPLFYLLPALTCRLGFSIETQLRAMRLFGAVLFGFTGVVAAAWAQTCWSPMTNDRARQRPASSGRWRDGTGGWTGFSMVHSALIVLLPMPAFIAGSANNDALAMLTATAVFAAVARIQTQGLTWQRGIGVFVLLVLALLSKKTNWFLLPWLVLLGLGGALWRPVAASGSSAHDQDPDTGAVRTAIVFSGFRPVLLVSVVSFLVLLGMLLLPSAAPAAWRGNHQPLGQGRVQVPGSGWATRVSDSSRSDFGRLYQSVTGDRVASLRGQTVQASALVRAGDGVPSGQVGVAGRLTVRDATGYTQTRFVADSQWQRVELTHTVASAATYVKLALAPGVGESEVEVGSFLVDDVSLRLADPRQGHSNQLRNTDFRQPARWIELVLVAPLEERWQQFAPRLRSDQVLAPEALRRFGLYAALLFPGFWGNFGWLQRPLPLAIYVLLALVCLAAIAGLIQRWRRSPASRLTSSHPGQPDHLVVGPSSPEGSEATVIGPGVRAGVIQASWLLATAFILVQTLLPMLGRTWQPQGRYLFPALFPLAGLLLIGLGYWWCRAKMTPRAALVAIIAVIGLDVFCLIMASRIL